VEDKMKIGIVGVGVVGGAVKYGMEKLGHDVRVHDIALDTRLEDVLNTELCFICVPTPEKEDGDCDSDIVESVISDLSHLRYTGIVVIKSTITPGTTDRIRKEYSNSWNTFRGICFVPEFLRERCAIADFTENHDVCVIGVKQRWGEGNGVYETIKMAHGKYPQKFVRMTPTEAELCKYFSNVYNAMRVTFANGFYEVCQKLGADYTKIKDAVVQRPTLIDMYLDCNEKFRGFAGVCLPKDTAAFAKLVEDLDIDCKLFRTIVEDNKLYNPTVYEHMRME
jgi:UDPglucose 6-dehydrogenase